jgi:hypothetical protein
MAIPCLPAHHQQGGIEIQFEPHPAVVAPPAGDIKIEKHKIFEVRLDRVPLMVEAVDPQPLFHLDGFILGQHQRAAVTLLFRRVPQSVVGCKQLVVFLGHLLGHCFDLLQADHIRIILLDPIPTALFEHRPQPGHIPASNFHGAVLYQCECFAQL